MKIRCTIIFSIILATAFLALADRIFLSSGKEITGKILSFSSNTGLVVETEYGHITIKPGNLVSFEINEENSSDLKDKTSLENSTLYKNGLYIDTAGLENFNISYDVNVPGQGKFMVHGTAHNETSYFLVSAEYLGMPNEEYFEVIIKMQKAAMQYSIDGEKSVKNINGLDYIFKEYSGMYSGIDLTYVTGVFTHNDVNFRVITWTFTSIYEKIKEDLWSVFDAVKIIDS